MRCQLCAASLLLLYDRRESCCNCWASLLTRCAAAVQVPALQQLNMYGCRRASGPQLQVVLDRLPALKWISLNGCHGITTLHLTRRWQQGNGLGGCVLGGVWLL